MDKKIKIYITIIIYLLGVITGTLTIKLLNKEKMEQKNICVNLLEEK